MSKPKKTQVNDFRIMHGIVQEGGARFSVLVDKPVSLTEIEQIATFMKYSVDQARAQIAAAKNQAEKKDHENMPLPEMKGEPDQGSGCHQCNGSGVVDDPDDDYTCSCGLKPDEQENGLHSDDCTYQSPDSND